MVRDYSSTNKMILGDAYPLPLTEDLVSIQSKAELFSTIDLRDAFHQVALDPASRPITNVHLPGGLWQWTVVPQGISVGPALLQRDIDATCRAIQQHTHPYFDDLLVATASSAGESAEDLIQRHATDVRETLAALEADRWVSDPTKVHLFMKRVEFVGHVLGGGRRTPAPGKLAAVQLWRPPMTVSSLRGFLGLCNYYSGYVPMYAQLAAPLQEKLKLPREVTRAGSKHPIEWTAEETEAFERLKQALVADLQLAAIDPAKPFIIRTDASDYAIGAVIEQSPGEGLSSIPVGFMSRKLTNGQRLRWDTRDKETYAVVSALDKWAPYLLGNKVLVLTDHKSIESWYKEHVAGVGPQGRRARWHAKLNQFQLEVVYVPGPSNEVADALSRWAYPASEAYRDISWHGTPEDDADMRREIAEERARERACPVAAYRSRRQSPTH
jgi:hypothetical protein